MPARPGEKHTWRLPHTGPFVQGHVGALSREVVGEGDFGNVFLKDILKVARKGEAMCKGPGTHVGEREHFL